MLDSCVNDFEIDLQVEIKRAVWTVLIGFIDLSLG